MSGLIVLAVSEAAVVAAVGCARRDPDLARAMYRQALALDYGLLTGCDSAELTVASLLRHPDPRLPLDGGPDGYWQALGLLGLVAARDATQVPEFGALYDIEAALAAVDVAGPQSLVALSRRPPVPLPEPLDVELRVLPAAAAQRAARAWVDALADAEGAPARFTQFCRRYLALAAAEPGLDWVLLTPMRIDVPRPFTALPSPPPPLPAPRADPTLLALADELTSAVPAEAAGVAPARLHARFETVEGLYVRHGHRLEWRFDDGLARATRAAAEGEPIRVLGHVTPAWGAAFDAALAAAGFPQAGPGDDVAATLTLGTTSVTLSEQACRGRYAGVVELLDAALATLAPGTVEHAPAPAWALPLD